HEVLGRVVRVGGDGLAVGAAQIIGVVLLQDVPARGLGHDDVLALAHGSGQGGNVLPGLGREGVEVPGVEPGGAAAADVGDAALDAVALVDLDEVLAYRGVLVLDQARGEDGHL